MQQQERTRIFSHITRTRFLHLEDALQPAAEGKPGKIRFFIGQYRRRDQGGQGAEATAYHFLDDADARPIMVDLSWSRPLDIKDYKGSANGGAAPLSRVLKVKGPKDGKYWIQIDNGPGEIIGQGAVKPAGEPDVSVSIALSIYEARKMALAVIEYMTAYRAVALLPTITLHSQSPPRHIDPSTGEISDVEALFGPEPAPARADPPAPRPQSEPKKAKEGAAEDKPTTFYALAPQAIKDHGLLELVQELVQAPGSWTEKSQRLQQAMAT